ncbi:MAG: ATP-binding cassette domain-containing protein [Spirochaetaceae bacterium]|jgi:zinc transport system ATP-binding protein|nr:ATP-binding cassette domain-containing protein [Spirochaetaceae bacterium]
MALITCKDAVFGYDGKVVSRGVNFEIEKGELVCVLGENGCGKTTLIKGLLRLIKPFSGLIETGKGLAGAGYLPQQNPDQKDFPASVEEIVLSGRVSFLGWRPFYGKKDKMIALENMRKLHIDSMRKTCFRELSGGQQKRALLARALSASVDMLILDEPAAGLDMAVTNEVYSILENLNKNGSTIILVTHDVDYALRSSRKIIHLFSGGSWFGTVDEYKKTEHIKKWRTG